MTLPIVPAQSLPSQAWCAWLPLRYQLGSGLAYSSFRLGLPPVAVARAGSSVKIRNRGPYPVGLGFTTEDRFNLVHTLGPGVSIAFAPATADLYAVISTYPLGPGTIVIGVTYYEPIAATLEVIGMAPAP